MAKTKEGLTNTIDANTNKLQLKLRAIAKHIGALADELDAIDNMFICPQCGNSDICKSYINGGLNRVSCNGCGYVITDEDDELPTRFEGSE